MIEVLVLWSAVVALFLLGLIGIFMPLVPGIGLVFGGVLLYAGATGFETVSVGTVISLGAVTGLAWLSDWAGAAFGAKYGGGKWPAVAGSVAGATLGLVAAGPIGLFAGAFLGALAGALYEGKSLEKAGKAAIYSVIGMVGATIAQFILAVGIITAFVIAVVF